MERGSAKLPALKSGQQSLCSVFSFQIEELVIKNSWKPIFNGNYTENDDTSDLSAILQKLRDNEVNVNQQTFNDWIHDEDDESPNILQPFEQTDEEYEGLEEHVDKEELGFDSTLEILDENFVDSFEAFAGIDKGIAFSQQINATPEEQSLIKIRGSLLQKFYNSLN